MSPGFIPQPPGSRALDAGEWFAYACQLEGLNLELARRMAVLLEWIASREDLLALYHAEAQRRWP
jgi:hypothetical protein